jgi:uncharacterized protein (TIGR02145 family)
MKKQSLSVFAVLASTLILVSACLGNVSKSVVDSNSVLWFLSKSQHQIQNLNNYPTVTIGGMNWMSENLKITTFSNGDPILEVKTEAEWAGAANSKTAAFRIVNGVYFYNGYAVKDVRRIAPEGFRVASSVDFNSLMTALGGGTSVDGKAAKAMANYTWEIEEWNESTGDLRTSTIKGTNSAGFNATKGGFCYEFGDVNVGGCSYWWTSDGGAFDIGYCSQDLGGGYSAEMSSGYGFEVRCVKN